MTKMHFKQAADMVRAIQIGDWTFDPPAWADEARMQIPFNGDNSSDYTRAVWTAEAFILLFQQYNDRFNVNTFLRACGLK